MANHLKIYICLGTPFRNQDLLPMMVISFLLAPKFKQSGVKMENVEYNRYDGTIEELTPNGYYVRYDGWGNREEVDPDNVRPIQESNPDPLLEAEKIAVATKEALKRKIAQAASKESESWTVPQKLQIDPNDSEDVKAAKRKKLHAFKSKMRMEAKEVTQNKRQNAWQQFQTTKGRAKKVGFFSGRKRESIFKSPDDPFGKVGVTGSGKGLTEFQKREKHLHLKGGNIEGADE
ncbi:hypothetical protein MIMGU_mgv1a010686mg [Erythranthe guttata]|uniref:Tudor domain-containing protein n=1 Tax=Erythranthe guttata TaxID=4155 RepID=A0A022QXB4_ERYGU|nr:hypothetical protein MIMGU_mgv1a010686mg [Erythranthe guttata]